MNSMIFKTNLEIKTNLRSEPTVFGSSFLVTYRDRPGNKPSAFVRATNYTGGKNELHIPRFRAKVPEISASPLPDSSMVPQLSF